MPAENLSNLCPINFLTCQETQARGLTGTLGTGNIPFQRNGGRGHVEDVSCIPHSHFAKIGEGAGSCNISVFWPRMKHRSHLTSKWATLVPVEIQSYWLTEIVYPGILHCANTATLPYVDYTMEEWRWKSTRKQYPLTKTTSIDSTKLTEMQTRMWAIIKQNPNKYDMFGSFFFVADIRGIKWLTTVIVGDHGTPYQLLCKNYPSMDWEYMMDRQHGQLFIDLGMGFHPDPDSQEPLIGLWRLDKTHASYAAAGMKAGNIHHLNTL